MARYAIDANPFIPQRIISPPPLSSRINSRDFFSPSFTINSEIKKKVQWRTLWHSLSQPQSGPHPNHLKDPTRIVRIPFLHPHGGPLSSGGHPTPITSTIAMSETHRRRSQAFRIRVDPGANAHWEASRRRKRGNSERRRWRTRRFTT